MSKESDFIKVKKASVHNLKDLSFSLPKNKLIVFSGVSGSGKSSLAFDTIFAEGQRRYIESLSPYARQFLGQMERPQVEDITGLSPAIAIDQKSLSHNPRSTVGTLTEIYDYLRVLYARMGKVYCPICNEKIEKLSLDEMIEIIEKKSKQLGEKKVTLIAPVIRGRKGEYYEMLYKFLRLGFQKVKIDGKYYQLKNKINLSRHKTHTIELLVDTLDINDKTRLTEAVENTLFYGKGLLTFEFSNYQKLLSSLWSCPNDNFTYPEIEPRLFSFNSPFGACEECSGLGKTGWRHIAKCLKCDGKRLKNEALSILIRSKNIFEIVEMTIDKSYEFFVDFESKLTINEKIIAENLVKEIIDRLSFLLEVGLDYMTLSRESETLSGGEAQRIRLSSQIGSKLSGTLYVLDEPTIGLHEKDTEKLINTLKYLKKLGNTVIIVEHDERTIKSADYLLDLGPGAGKDGGEIVASGTLKKLLTNQKSNNSLTLKYLTGEEKIELPNKRRNKIKEKLKIISASANNLKNLSVEIPLKKFVCITGVSGSGKSSLLYDVIYRNINLLKNSRGIEKFENVKDIIGTNLIEKIIIIDQSPIGRTPRSNPATYTGAFTPIREFYSQLSESKERGYSLSRFSFNVAGGRCEACEGAGYKKIEMHFLPTVFVGCEICHGKRFNRESLEVKYKGKNIADVLALTVDEACDFFKNNYRIADKLKSLKNVGLSYIQLGQSATTLSGGEAQRIKLAKELSQPMAKRILYLLDEPTVGLHQHDIKMLLKVLNNLIKRENSVLMIEHNLHMIKSADWIIDIGPKGGEKGGKIIATGTPEMIANNPNSITGKYLKEYLK